MLAALLGLKKVQPMVMPKPTELLLEVMVVVVESASTGSSPLALLEAPPLVVELVLLKL